MTANGSPYASHTDAETETMLSAIGAESEAALFDIPEPVRFDEALDIEQRSERSTERSTETTISSSSSAGATTTTTFRRWSINSPLGPSF